MPENDVSSRRPEVAEALERGQIVRDLLGGTPAMQAAGERYIFRARDYEPERKFQARLNAAVLLNAYARTVSMLSGQVFARDPVVGEEGETLAEPFAALVEDANLQGDNLAVWAAEFFAGALNDGVRLILVDYPRVETRREDGQLKYKADDGSWRAKTAQADAENGWRPYLVALPLESVLGWRFEMVNGRRTLTQLRFMEQVLDRRGEFDTDDSLVDQVRVLFPGRYQIWRQKKAGGGGKGPWEMVEEGSTTLPAVPVALFMPGQRIGDGLAARPALEDLAHLNRRHWQASVDQADLMGWVRRPAWLGAGLTSDPNAEVPFGCGRLLTPTDPTARLESVGVDAASVEAGRRELADLEERMALFGLSLLVPKTGGITATENAIDAAESDSTLKRWALGLKDCLEQALVFAALWAGLAADEAPGVAVNTDFHPLALTDPALLLEAAERGVIPRRMVFEEFRRRGLLPDQADWAEALAEMEDEARQGSAGSLGAGLAAKLLGRAA